MRRSEACRNAAFMRQEARSRRNLSPLPWPAPFRCRVLRRFVTVTKVSDTLVINEIYLSLQGESTFAGLPCIFVRLTACGLRCSYCDTAYAFTEGAKMSLPDICANIKKLAKPFANAAG